MLDINLQDCVKFFYFELIQMPIPHTKRYSLIFKQKPK